MLVTLKMSSLIYINLAVFNILIKQMTLLNLLIAYAGIYI